MELASKYDPKEVESKWYQYWLDKKLFSSKPDGRAPYTIVIPPPNVTGVLHMGHMLNNTIQDILVRRARMEGKNACWVPGTDHASIATEAKVVNKLAQQGIKKTDLTRDEFLKHAWDWTHEHGGIILKQLRRLGASCDWDRTAFTMDEKRQKSVLHVFKKLYDEGYIYRGEKFELDYKPTSVKNSSTNTVGNAYSYELQFVSLKYELERCEMRDLVPYDNGLVYPTPLTIEFTGNASKLAERIQTCLDALYTGSHKWTITVLSSVSDDEKNISISQSNCWSAVSLFNTEYGLNFYIS